MAYNPITEKLSFDEVLFNHSPQEIVPTENESAKGGIPWIPIIFGTLGSVAIGYGIGKMVKIYYDRSAKEEAAAMENQKHQTRQDIDIAILKDKVG